jgi:REP element-mobilizing transposase RayT
MGLKNKISEGYTYFLTLTVVDWVAVFTRPCYKQILVDSLRYCQQAKGLAIYAWVLMSNHLHLLASATKEGISLSDILRGFKKFTSKKIVEAIEAEAVFSYSFFEQKLAYIHDNPVRAEIVEFPEEYLYSSARNYARKRSLLELVVC